MYVVPYKGRPHDSLFSLARGHTHLYTTIGCCCQGRDEDEEDKPTAFLFARRGLWPTFKVPPSVSGMSRWRSFFFLCSPHQSVALYVLLWSKPATVTLLCMLVEYHTFPLSLLFVCNKRKRHK